ncbi:YSC84-related protein [Rhodospirillum sp. A1_3_36]|uniref:lipid-binding SYLF domain-containing protein n=1 Tax=Rhodospirillum sp. A1_3_36 TaxID=3391666 RepID=UPI0039A5004B
MSRFIRALALGAPLALSLADPALAQNNGPVLLVPNSPSQPPPATGPAYGQEFSTPQATTPQRPTPQGASPSNALPPLLESQEIHTSPNGSSQPGRTAPATAPMAAPVTAPSQTPTPATRSDQPTSQTQALSQMEMKNTSATDARSLIAEAEATVVRLTNNSGFKKELRQLIDRARAIMVVPSFYKAGFIVGAAYGNGLLMTRGSDGTFSDPAFYSLTAGSVGFQIGVQENEVVMAIMTDAGLKAVMEDQFKGGANVSVTFLVAGGGAEASTTTDVGEDIYAFSHSIGLFSGAGLEGTAIQPKTNWNDAIYGVGATPNAILINRVLTTPLAEGLKRSLVER